jgi:hypothetical protein
MDEFKKRLKQDADGIHAEVSQKLEDRIRASLRATRRHAPQSKRRSATSKLWWASSLTGLAAALIAIVVVNLQPVAVEPAAPVAANLQTVPDYQGYMEQLQERLPLRTDSVEFTRGLEEELVRLQADLEKARENVSRDIDFTF